MTDKRERAALMGIYDCLNTMTGLMPSNPANVRQVSAAGRAMSTASSCLMCAVSSLAAGDLVLACEFTADAQRSLASARQEGRA